MSVNGWKKTRRARFTGDPNWLPYEAFDSHGNYTGIVSEHLDLIAEHDRVSVQDESK